MSGLPRQGSFISVGTPQQPIELPLVKVVTYLGIQLSYGNLELQTCNFRLRAAKLVRQRLLRILHSSGLRIRVRLQLHGACVRSSLLFGIHAVGVNLAVMKRLEAADARFVRAIARDPVHLTRTSNSVLFRRLRYRMLAEVPTRLLKSRVKRSKATAAVAHFRSQLNVVLAMHTDSQVCAQHGMCSIEAVHQVACDVCGIYLFCQHAAYVVTSG